MGKTTMIHVQGTVNPNPLTQVSEPASPFTGTNLSAGSAVNVTVGPFTNNSAVPLKITSALISNLVNCSVTPQATLVLPINLAPGATANLSYAVNSSASGPYSFDVAVTWST